VDPVRRFRLVGAACAAAAAILFATKAVAIRWALLHGADATALVALRMGLALPGFVLAAWWLGRDRAPLSRRELLLAGLCGVAGYHLASWCDTMGLQYISVALERVILYGYPTLVVLFTAVRERRLPSRTLATAVVVTWAGIVISCLDQPMASAAGLGVLLVALSAVAFAGQQTVIEPIMRRHGGARVAALAMCASCPGVVLHGLVQVPLATWVSQDGAVWAVAGYLGFCGTIVPVLLAGLAIARIGAGPAAVIGTVGPGVTVLGGWLVLGEVPSTWTWVGFAMTVAGAAWLALRK
jgi:drug/metabolite transporter (DMT)-like permease